MQIEDCPFRFDVHSRQTSETARCRLIEQITGMDTKDNARVSRSACQACATFATNGMLASHPVLPSLLFQQCETALELATPSECVRLKTLKTVAEQAIEAQGQLQRSCPVFPTCDVLLAASQPTPELVKSIESILDQESVGVFLHLVDLGNAASVFDLVRQRGMVFRYRMPPGTSSLAALHALIESMRTPFIALQSPNCISHPRRLFESITSLLDNGAEVFYGPCSSDQFVTPIPSIASFHSSLVLRRATFVDLGGTADRSSIHPGFDDAHEFVQRATRLERKIFIGETPLIRKNQSVDSLDADRRDLDASLKANDSAVCHGVGFPKIAVACDVVLPFHGHLALVEQSLSSLIEQSGAETVIHLVDDATSFDTSDFLQKYSSHRYIRIYRNTENIGQFQSFNNVSRYFETELAAIQDADDISLPDRIHWAGQMMHYSQADFFAGAVQLFGVGQPDSPVIRRSFYPRENQDWYFAENPTATFRVSMFRDVGGFADFGDRLSNRASLDTEFQIRCRYHGVRFALSNEVVVRYRVHAQSATQNEFTGWGTQARKNASKQFVDRFALFVGGGFDPKSFGSIGRYQAITVRLNS
jgi:Glycosyl transferase family 2